MGSDRLRGGCVCKLSNLSWRSASQLPMFLLDRLDSFFSTFSSIHFHFTQLHSPLFTISWAVDARPFRTCIWILLLYAQHFLLCFFIQKRLTHTNTFHSALFLLIFYHICVVKPHYSAHLHFFLALLLSCYRFHFTQHSPTRIDSVYLCFYSFTQYTLILSN